MGAPLLRIEQDGRVLRLTIDRVELNNAISPELTDEIDAALAAAERDDSVGLLVLTGAGAMFSAGGNLQQLLDGLANRDVVRERTLLARAQNVVDRLRSFPKPTIAMVNGAAAGGGLAYALACDVRVAAEEARLVYAYGRIGLAGDLGMNWLLARLIGPARATAFALGPGVKAAEALRLGLVDACVPRGELEAAVARIAGGMLQATPHATARIKRNIEAAARLSYAEAGAREIDSFLECRDDPEHRDAVAALLGR